MNETQEPITLEQLRRVVRRRRWIVLQCLLAGALAGALIAVFAPQRHEATATALVESSAGGTTSAAAPGSLTAQAAARLVRTRGVAERVSDELGGTRSAGELLGAVASEADDTGSFVTVTATDEDPRQAARIANAFADEFIAVRAENVGARVDQAIQAGERQLAQLPPRSGARAQLRSELAELRATAVLRSIDAEVIDPAVPSAGGGERRRSIVYGVVGGALGLLVGLAIAFALEALDPRLRTLGEVRRVVHAPQLAAMPRRRGRRRAKGPAVLTAEPEPFEHLRGALLVFNGEPTLRRLVVTSPTDRTEGKTEVAANLAVSLARAGLRVCVVDADLRHPQLAPQFGLAEDAPGLADALRGAPLAEAVQRFSIPASEGRNGSGPAAGAAVSVVTAGRQSGEASALLAGERIQAVLEELAREHDVVIGDCPPLLAAGDALPLLEQASGALLVVRHSHTLRRSLVRAAQVVQEARGTILGVVTTGVPKRELAVEGYGPWPSPAAAKAGHDVQT